MNVVFYGGTGQAKMMYDIIKDEVDQMDIIDDFTDKPPFKVNNFYSGRDAYEKWKKYRIGDYFFAVTIGNPHGKIRRKLYQKLINDGLQPLQLIHPNAELNIVSLGCGLQIHSSVIVNSDAKIGHYCILNTRSLIEHDSILKDGVEIGPGAIVCGETLIGQDSWIGAGAVVRDKIKIGKNCIIGMGAVVTKNINDNITVVGNPARRLDSY